METPAASLLSSNQPSHTSSLSAAHLALHQLACFEGGQIFSSPLCHHLVTPAELQEARDDPFALLLRCSCAARLRFAQDHFLCYQKVFKVEQVIILGAGLDTFAFSYDGPACSFFEVDHPATQQMKRQRLANASMPIPSDVHFVPFDFETASLGPTLCLHGFDPSLPTFISCLGVFQYLTLSAIQSILAFVALVPNSQLVFDFLEPSLNQETRQNYSKMIDQYKAMGEPFLSLVEKNQMLAMCSSFQVVELLGPKEILHLYCSGLNIDASSNGCHFLCIRTF